MIIEEIYFVIRVVFQMTDYGYIRRNYDELQDELRTIAKNLGTKPPKLVCVTKSGSDEELLALAAAGAEAIGENRPGELKRRGELLSAAGFFKGISSPTSAGSFFSSRVLQTWMHSSQIKAPPCPAISLWVSFFSLPQKEQR